MIPCTCGHVMYRHEAKTCKAVENAQRYRCRVCRKTVTIRAGQVSTLRGRPPYAPRVAA